MDSNQASSKGKEIIHEEAEKRGKKVAGRGRGKAKLIATGHKSTQKGGLLKRGGVLTEEEQIGIKKLKVTGAEEKGVQEEGAGMLVKLKKGDDLVVPIVISECDGNTDVVKEGLNESQPRQEK